LRFIRVKRDQDKNMHNNFRPFIKSKQWTIFRETEGKREAKGKTKGTNWARKKWQFEVNSHEPPAYLEYSGVCYSLFKLVP
jgi:hypothetical protein